MRARNDGRYLGTMFMRPVGDLPGWIILVIVVLGLWETVWKGVALWRAGVDRNLLWFVLMFVFNTVGILEIVYIFAISRPRRAREATAAAASAAAAAAVQ